MADLFHRVGHTLGLGKYLELTVEDDGNLDLAEFDVATHAGVLLDGVGDAMMLHSRPGATRLGLARSRAFELLAKLHSLATPWRLLLRQGIVS